MKLVDDTGSGGSNQRTTKSISLFTCYENLHNSRVVIGEQHMLYLIAKSTLIWTLWAPDTYLRFGYSAQPRYEYSRIWSHGLDFILEERAAE